MEYRSEHGCEGKEDEKQKKLQRITGMVLRWSIGLEAAIPSAAIVGHLICGEPSVTRQRRVMAQ